MLMVLSPCCHVDFGYPHRAELGRPSSVIRNIVAVRDAA
jgi:hypothetical protein